MPAELKEYFAGALFIISLSVSSVGILTSITLRKRFTHGFFETLIYYQVFIYVFGFYGIWGQLLSSYFLAPYLDPAVMGKTLNIVLLSASPFLVLAWLILITGCMEISGRVTGKWFRVIFLSVNFILLIVTGFVIDIDSAATLNNVLKYLYISLNAVYSLTCTIILGKHRKGFSILSHHSSKALGLTMLLFMVIQNLTLLLFARGFLFVVLFVLFYFLGGAVIPVVIRYFADITPVILRSGSGLSFQQFCNRFEVSRREVEIIEEVCNGLSNQEIADKLYISLTTVKGHLYRIFSKTNIRSRSQLISLVTSFDER